MEDNEFNVLTTENGSVAYSPEVVATISGIAARSVDGVAGMIGGLSDGITEFFGSKNHKKGVKVDMGKVETIINSSIIVKNNVHIPTVCAKVQEAITDAVETMTGLKVVEVNIFVQSVEFDSVAKNEGGQKPEQKRLQ